MAKNTKPILDTKTKQEYPSMYSAGKAIGQKLVPEYTGEARLIWFAMARKFPGRFKTLNAAGEWVDLNDPSVPKITRVRKTETDEQKEQRLLAELGAIAARKTAAGGAAATNGGNKGAAVPKKTAAPVAAAEAEETEEVETEVAEVDEAAAQPVRGKPKLAAAMRQA